MKKAAFCLVVLLAFASHSFASKRSSPDDLQEQDFLSDYFIIKEEKEKVSGSESPPNADEEKEKRQREEEEKRQREEHDAIKAFRSINQAYDIEFCRGPIDADSTMFMVSWGGLLHWDTCQMIKIRDYNQIRTIANQIIAMKRVSGHPNCGRLLDWGLHGNNNIYIITSNQYRGTLANLVGTMQQYNLEFAPVVLRDMAEALDLIHNNNIDHLMLTMENIYLDHKGNFVLDGFTQADVCDDEDARETVYSGKPLITRYSAPGLIQFVLDKDASRPSSLFKADIWSLGVVAYRIITGRFPYGEIVQEDGETTEDYYRRMYDKMASQTIDFDPILESMGAKWADFIAGMLSFDPNQRPPAIRIQRSSLLSSVDDFDSARKRLQTVMITAPGNRSPIAFSQAIKAHMDHQVAPFMVNRIYQGCKDIVERADAPDEMINIPTFPFDPTAFFDNPSFSLVRVVSVIGHEDVRDGSIDDDRYGGRSELSFFKALFNMPDGRTCDGMVQVERLDRIRSLKSKGNEILAMQKLGLLRREPELLFGNVAFHRRDLFAWPFRDVLKKKNLTAHQKESLIMDLIREIAYINRMGIIMTYLSPSSLAVRSDGSLGVLSFRGANLIDHEMSFSWPCETTHYCAPERIENTLNRANQPQISNASVDAWSVGVIAFEIACGERFVADTNLYYDAPIHDDHLRHVRDTLLATANMDSTWTRLNGTVSPVLVQIIRLLLDPNPKTRINVGDVNLDISIRHRQPGHDRHTKATLTRSRRAEIVKLMGTEPEANFIDLSRQVAYHLTPKDADEDNDEDEDEDGSDDDNNDDNDDDNDDDDDDDDDDNNDDNNDNDNDNDNDNSDDDGSDNDSDDNDDNDSDNDDDNSNNEGIDFDRLMQYV